MSVFGNLISKTESNGQFIFLPSLLKFPSTEKLLSEYREPVFVSICTSTTSKTKGEFFKTEKYICY